MAEAIEARRVELGITPGDLAKRAGVTTTGLAPVRKGYRRRYLDETKFGVARALHWPGDAIDRLMDGQVPDESWNRVTAVVVRSSSVESAIGADPNLDERSRRMLLAMYRAAIEGGVDSGGDHPEGGPQ